MNHNSLEVVSIVKYNSSIEIDYEIKGDWQKYFDLTKKMSIEYSCNIESVPDSVAVIPLIGNILPIAWLCNAEIILDELDQDFYENLDDVKKGYADMYPMLDFTGKTTISNIVNNRHDLKRSGSATFFSGGADAYTTLFRHMDESPFLIALWGADIKLQNVAGWKKVSEHIRSVSQEYDLGYIYVKTNFREIILGEKLNLIVRKSGDDWWHGFQHGIGLISHAAPIAYKYGMEKVYIASSYPEKMKGQYTCASDPTIDNHVAYCGCRTIHDGYELDRQEKIRYLVSQKKTGKPISLRVCWKSSEGSNCCRCEKCYRTALEIVSETGNPNEFGFVWGDQNIRHCERDLKYKIRQPQPIWNQFYPPIQEMLRKNYQNISDAKKYQWLQEIDFSHINNTVTKKIRYSIVVKGIKKVVHALKAGKKAR